MAMEPEDDELMFSCASCGAPIWTDIDRYFPASDETFLCWTCSVQRGGAYDANQDRWTKPPDVSGIADERRPHA
jgi:hypothetical protein